MNYAQQTIWRELQDFLPVEYRLNPSEEPTEEWWDHQGHRIHLDTYRNTDSPVKVILFHGVGTNGRQMTTILGRPLADLGYETIAIDMPTYGVTQVSADALVTYDEWVQIGSDLVDFELAKDDRPIVLYGLSAGGMETYHVAALNKKVAGIVGMTFLDTSLTRVKTETGFDPISGRFSGELMGLLNKIGFGKVKLPMRYVSKMRALVNDKDAKKAWYRDNTSAGNVVTVAFLDSWLAYRPVVAPEDFDIAPVLLTQPSADRWTPLHLAEPFLDRITRVPVTKVMLPNGGHYPLEKEALDLMVESIASFLKNIEAK
ncbi:alpha/beta fold hydrolase [Corynebacterium sp.]|uniref:alpha/beta hydrolase n=1 Tax=Corynebacterium sp. TaxID=1720 RepID=UPI0025B9CDA8|nr:alpha/beta fold hydrolase [Corynebacterium sp.]